MANQVISLFKSKYLVRPITYQGLERVEALEYPEAAFQEAILNAIIRKDYSGTFTFLQVDDDWLELWNLGPLPEELTIEKMKHNPSSYRRNVNVANVFFKTDYVKSRGRVPPK